VQDPKSPRARPPTAGNRGLKAKTWGVFLILATAALLWWMKVEFNRSPSGGSSGGPNKSSASGRPEAAGYGFRVGDSLVYDFTTQGELRLGTAKVADAAPDLKITETGRLQLHIYSATIAGWIVGFSWEKVRLLMDNGQSVTDATPADLAGPEILVFVEKFGRIDQVQVPANLSTDARNNWRDILPKWQVILPQTLNTSRWTRTEEDATGEFVAQYSMSGASFPADIAKKKSRYLRLSSGNASLAATYKIQSSVQIHFDAYPRIIAGAEKISFDGVQALGQTSSAGTFSFSLGSVTASPDRTLAQIDLSKYEPTPWAAEFSPDENASAANYGDFATNLLDLRGVIKNGGYNTPDEVRVAQNLIGQLKQTPGLADKLLDELASPDTTKDLAAALLGILGAAGTPAAQSDLLAVATSDDWPLADREMALFSYAQTVAPVPEADATLEALYQQGGELANTTLLALAVVGDKVRADPARFQPINDFILGVLNTPNLSLNDYLATLDAISNLGPAQVPAAVVQAAQSDNELVRMKAIGSLTRIKTDQSLALVMNAISNDPSGDVQVAGIKTLVALKNSAAVGDLSIIAVSGNSSAARREALNQLAPYAPFNPDVLAIINTAAQKDPLKEVRDLANQLLGNSDANPPSTTGTAAP